MVRTSNILIRVTGDEKKILERKARKSGVSVSEFIRATAIYSDDKQINIIDLKPFRQFVFELTKQGTNLNQYMKFLNTHQLSHFRIREARAVLDEEVRLLKKGSAVLLNLQKEFEKHRLYFVEMSDSNDDY